MSTSGGVAPLDLVFPSTATGFTSTLNISNLKIDAIESNIAIANSHVFPNRGISTTLTGAAGDNIRLIGASGRVTWTPAINLQATSRVNVEGGSGASIDIQGILSGPGWESIHPGDLTEHDRLSAPSCIHSNRGSLPSKACGIFSTAASALGRPSGWNSGLKSAGPPSSSVALSLP